MPDKFDYISGAVIPPTSDLILLSSTMKLGELVYWIQTADYHNAVLKVLAPSNLATSDLPEPISNQYYSVGIDRFRLFDHPGFGKIILMIEDPSFGELIPDSASNFESKIGMLMFSGCSFYPVLYVRSRDNLCRSILRVTHLRPFGTEIILSHQSRTIDIFK